MKPASRARLPLPPRPLPLRQPAVVDAYPIRPPLPPDQMTLLRLLALRAGHASLAELSADGHGPAHATGDAVDTLAALGLVELRQHPLVPSHATVALTPLGRRILREAR